MKDLVILTACKDAEHALRGLLSRPAALGIREVTVDYFVHPQKDPGCRCAPDQILASQCSRYHHALVVFDCDGSGEQDPARAQALAEEVESRLATTGWEQRVRVVVIEPELEQWAWSDSPRVDEVLGWGGRSPTLRDWLRHQGYLHGSSTKAQPPKEAMAAALRHVRKPWSSRLFEELGRRVSVERCQEPSFTRLRAILADWFAAS
jgi:hypothetical protein